MSFTISKHRIIRAVLVLKNLRLKNIIRFLPLIIVLVILVYLESINSTSEVYIDLVAEQIRFDTTNQNENRSSTELITGILVDSLQLFNCNMEIGSKEILDHNGNYVKRGSGIVNITKKYKENSSQLRLIKFKRLYLKSLLVPDNSNISISKEDNLVTLSIMAGENSGKPNNTIYGTIGVGEKFFLSGENIVLSDLSNYSDYESFTIATRKLFPNISFQGNDRIIILQFYFSEKQIEETSLLLENLLGKNLSFAIIEKAKKKDRVNSTIINGKIQIAGIDFFGKQFLIKEEMLEESDFLHIPSEEEYFVDYIKLDDKGLKISLWNEKANELEKGKRRRLTRSIFPSVLDFIIEEPSKKTVWVIFIFLLTQGSFLWKFFRK